MKKGQAAMEFLMTYGWAILVVIAAIAALAYFGVLDPARLLPERCQFPAGMDCIDKASITNSSVTVALRNNQGFPVTIDNAVVTGCNTPVVFVGSANTTSSSIPYSIAIPNNEVFRVKVTCTGLISGAKFDEDFSVSYTNTESGLSNQAVGSVRGRVA